MGNKCILRQDKLGSRGNIGGSAAHNYRDNQPYNADPQRKHLNEYTGAQSRAELWAALDARLAELDECDPQAIQLVEILITASPEAFSEHGGYLNSREYFDDAEAWLKDKFGAENVLGTCRHYDESTPHMHVYVIPVREMEAKQRKRSVIVGRDPETGERKRETRIYNEPAKKILSAKHWFDGPKKMSGLQTEFHKKVGQKYGLERGVEGSKAKHTTLKKFYGNLQKPLAPIPQPPKITGMNFLQAGKIIAEYDRDLGARLEPLFARARDRDNQAALRSDPSDRARAEAAEALNQRNAEQLQKMQELLAEAEAAARQNALIAAEQAETAEKFRLLTEKQRDYINRLEEQIAHLKGEEHDPLASMQPW